MIGQIHRAVVHAHRLRIGLLRRRRARGFEIGRPAAPIDRAQRRALFRVVDQQPAPALRIARRRRLLRDAHAIDDDFAWHETPEIQAFAHGARCGQQRVGGGDI